MEENIINVVTEQADVVENVVETAVDTVDAVEDINLDVSKGDVACLVIAGVTAVAGLGYLAWTKLIKPAIDKRKAAKQIEQGNTEVEQTEQTENTEYDPESDAE